MFDTPETPTPPVKKSEPLLSKTNLTLALATGAFVLALAPYILPNIQGLIVRGGILSRPEALMEGSRALQAKQDADLKKTVETAIKANEGALVAADDPVLGNPKAPITIVEFQDYLCGYCKVAAPQIEAFLKENPDVRVVVKEYPVIRPDQSRFLAALALGARDTGHYEAVHHALYAGDLKTDADVDQALTSAGVNPTEIRVKAQSPAVQAKIDETLKLGQSLGIQATPNFIIGGVLVNGADLNQVKTLVAAERTKLK